jgi:hypothetical protein
MSINKPGTAKIFTNRSSYTVLIGSREKIKMAFGGQSDCAPHVEGMPPPIWAIGPEWNMKFLRGSSMRFVFER